MSDALEITEQFDALTIPHAPERSGGQHQSHKVLIITLVALTLLVAAIAAAFFTARWYFADKAAPGVAIGDHVVTGQDADALKSTVEEVVKDSVIAIKDAEGNSVNASLSDLGVNVDVDATVQELLAAKSDDLYTRFNPFATTKVALDGTQDAETLSEFLTDQLVEESKQAIPASVKYDEKNTTFVVNEGKNGQAPETEPVDELVDTVIDDPGHTNTVTIEYSDVNSPISDDTAKQAADQANARLANDITISNGNAKQFTIPKDQVAKWIKLETDPGAGTISITYDEQGIKDYLADQLPKELNQEQVQQEDMVDKQGNVLLTVVKGVDGVNVGDTSTVANDVIGALNNGTSANLQVPTTVQHFTVKKSEAHMRVVVDRATQTATVYQDDKPVKTFIVCTGKTGVLESDLGTFTIYLRYAVHTMRGTNLDGSHYVSPNVPWVSFYNGGEGFHAAPWNPVGITTGNPSVYGSHGCINMRDADAKWIYEHVPQGSVVQVVGAQPVGAVRDANGNPLKN